MEDLISSAANPLAKRIRQLRDKKFRDLSGTFLIEGIQPVSLALASDYIVEEIIEAPELLKNPAVKTLVARAAEQGVRVSRITAQLFSKLSERDGPTGLACIARSRSQVVSEASVTSSSVYIALDEVANPGNLGTIIRTVDAAGASGVILIGDVSDPYSPQAVKSSMGSLFSVPIYRASGLKEFFDWARAGEVTVHAAAGGGASSHWATTFTPPAVLLFGNEGRGLPASAIDASDSSVRIPMVGTAESLNLATAVALITYEALRGSLDAQSPG